MATVFTKFPELITELRLEIWRLALPDPVDRPLYLYRRGCWTLKHLTEADPAYDPAGGNLYLHFDTDKLAPQRFELSLFFVNREARSVAQGYIRKQNLQARQMDGEQSLDFVRRFDFAADTMLIRSSDLGYFLGEHMERLFEPDLVQQNVTFENPVLPRIAIMRSGIELLQGGLVNLLDGWDEAGKTMYIVNVDDVEPDSHVRMELGDTSRASFIWRGSKQKWEVSGGDEAAIERLKGNITAISDEVAAVYGENRFEFRLVDIVEK